MRTSVNRDQPLMGAADLIVGEKEQAGGHAKDER
jgi:hypothetical protein